MLGFVTFEWRAMQLPSKCPNLSAWSLGRPYTMVSMTLSELKRIIEALILCHDAPMSLAHIKHSLDSDLSNEQMRVLLEEIAEEWRPRAVNLIQVSTGWRFQSAPDLAPFLDRMRAERPAAYSRAVLETLAIIAYRQPVTRGDIEDIRGVTVSSEIIKKLEERGWIDVVGHREVPGRPALLATTKQFLDDLGLQGLHGLPSLVQSDEGLDEPQLSLDGVKQLTQIIESHAAAHAEAAVVEVNVESLEWAHNDTQQADVETDSDEDFLNRDEPINDALAQDVNDLPT